MDDIFKRRQSTSTNPEVINQLKELEDKLRMGYPGVEINLSTFKHWSQVPKEIWEEIARKARINKIDLTVHAPFSGSQGNQFPVLTGMRPSEKGYVIDSVGKERVAYELKSILETAANLGKIYGDNIKITVHATSAVSGASWNKEYEEKLKETLRKDPEKFNDLKNKLLFLGLIKKDDLNKIKDPNDLPAWIFSTSTLVALEFPEGYVIKEYIDLHDKKYISEKLSEMKEKLIQEEAKETIVDKLYKYNQKYIDSLSSDISNKINQLNKEINRLNNLYFERDISTGMFLSYLNNIKTNLESIYETLTFVYSYYLKGEEKPQIEIKYIPAVVENLLELRKKIENLNNQIQNVITTYGVDSLESRKKIKEIIDSSNLYQDLNRFIKYEGNVMLNFALQEMKTINYPIIKPFPSVAMESAIDSFKKSLDRFLTDIKKNKDYLEAIDVVFPKIFFEHVYPEDVMSRPELLKEFVEKSRKALIETIEKHPDIKNKIIEKFGSLDKFADEYVGITLDVAHLKLFEKYGYGKEDIIKWIKDIKPYVKHIHVSESKYGEDVHIPLGMEKDEIIKAELEELKDLLAEKGISIVHEVGGWYSGRFFEYFGPEYQYFISYGTPGGEYHIETLYKLSIMPTYYANVYTADLPTLTVTYSGFSDIPLDLGSFRKEQKQDYLV